MKSKMLTALIAFSFFTSTNSFADEDCWRARLTQAAIKHLKLSQEEIQRDTKGDFVIICSSKTLKIKPPVWAGGGGCGSSSSCGTNFLIIEGYPVPLEDLPDPIIGETPLRPWKILSGETKDTNIFIAKDLDSAIKHMKIKSPNTQTILSPEPETISKFLLNQEIGSESKLALPETYNTTRPMHDLSGLGMQIKRYSDQNIKFIHISPTQ